MSPPVAGLFPSIFVDFDVCNNVDYVTYFLFALLSVMIEIHNIHCHLLCCGARAVQLADQAVGRMAGAVLRSHKGQEISLYFEASGPAVTSTQPPIQWIPKVLYQRIKQV
jgi:hypothetical protein